MKELYNFNNIKKDKITTILGFLIVLASVVSVFIVDTVNWSDAIWGIIIGLSLLPMSIKPSSTVNCMVLVAFTGVGIVMQSCTTYKRCSDKFGEMGDTVYVKQMVKIVDTVEVVTPADSAYKRIQLDSLLLMSHTDTIKIISKKGKARAKLYKDKTNNYLSTQVDCLPDTITKIIIKKIAVETPCPPIEIFTPKPKSGIGYWWERYKDVAAVGLPLLFMLLIYTINKND